MLFSAYLKRINQNSKGYYHLFILVNDYYVVLSV